ncbi:MAG: cytosolic protein, partial [Candidatus Schekmanbacteria bacterium]|nr:cytosolic protein [Candidatus Schekmanbacteria bacterium]
EVQGRAEDGFDERMFVYNYRIFDRYHREVISVAVLTDLDDDFRPGLYERQRWDCGVRFWFPVVKIVDYAKQWIQLEANLNPFALVVMAYVGATRTRDQKQRLAWKLRLVRMLYERGYNREEVEALFRFIDWLLILPAELEEPFRDEVEKMEKGEKMAYVTSIERLGIEKGERLGIQKGLLEAIDVGLSVRFPAQAAELLARARRIEAIERLKAITRALSSGEPLEAIDALLGPAEKPSE